MCNQRCCSLSDALTQSNLVSVLRDGYTYPDMFSALRNLMPVLYLVALVDSLWLRIWFLITRVLFCFPQQETGLIACQRPVSMVQFMHLLLPDVYLQSMISSPCKLVDVG